MTGAMLNFWGSKRLWGYHKEIYGVNSGGGVNKFRGAKILKIFFCSKIEEEKRHPLLEIVADISNLTTISSKILLNQKKQPQCIILLLFLWFSQIKMVWIDSTPSPH